jgi:hypothetical protein
VAQRSFGQLNIQLALSQQSVIAVQPLFEATFTSEIGILPADAAKVSLMACFASSSTDTHASGAREPLLFGAPALLCTRVDAMRPCVLLQIKEEHRRGQYGQQGAISVWSTLSNAK